MSLAVLTQAPPQQVSPTPHAGSQAPPPAPEVLPLQNSSVVQPVLAASLLEPPLPVVTSSPHEALAATASPTTPQRTTSARMSHLSSEASRLDDLRTSGAILYDR